MARAGPAAALLIVHLARSAAAVQPPLPELTAVVSQVGGGVTVAAPSDPGAGAEVRMLQVLGAGTVINVPAAGRIGVVCSTDRWLLLTGPERWSLTAGGCAEGSELPLGTFAELAPSGGLLRSLSGALVIEPAIRGEADGDPRVPVLLSPRLSGAREGRPPILWRRATGAMAYEIEIPGLGLRARIDASELACAPDHAWDDQVVCRWRIPAGDPELASAETYEISIRALGDAAVTAFEEEPRAWLRRLDHGEIAAVTAEREEVRRLPLDSAARGLLEAGVLARHGLRNEALEMLRVLDARHEVPEVELALGELYARIGLYGFADRAYRRVLASDPEPAVRAAALFGSGRCDLVRGRVEQALAAFREARALFSDLGLEEGAASAAAAADEAARRGGAAPSNPRSRACPVRPAAPGGTGAAGAAVRRRRQGSISTSRGRCRGTGLSPRSLITMFSTAPPATTRWPRTSTTTPCSGSRGGRSAPSRCAPRPRRQARRGWSRTRQPSPRS